MVCTYPLITLVGGICSLRWPSWLDPFVPHEIIKGVVDNEGFVVLSASPKVLRFGPRSRP